MKKPRTIQNENDLRTYIHMEAEESGHHVSHIESPITSPGIPDLNISRAGLDLWLEIKVMKRGGIQMRPAQRKWHRERAASQGWSFVVCWIDGMIYVHNGSDAAGWLPRSLKWRSGKPYALEEVCTMLAMLGTL